ncbi:hypothetical protein [Desulfatitalea alkaliphila]|uniref:Uncharacterized protein n=1 Tax=Desulfatitalea alkaliphila TaxID=2929485 RepID=A0AA41UMC5_9BACT|nr:hypothetical protein [Desulfatitalea alkaliphila]MCJ8502471.1 hypothetical protein [Desulfatitalea alkaliphila]
MTPSKHFKYNSLGLAISLAAAIIVYFSNSSIIGPMIQADESSYLNNAAAIAGFLNDHASSYGAGYSLLLVPAFWFAHTPATIWVGVKLINAALFFILVCSLWCLARLFSPEVPLARRIWAVILVSAYPMWVIMAGYSFSQIAFAPFYVLSFIAFTKCIRGKWGTWLLLGLLSGFLFWIHTTAIAVLIAFSVSCGFVAVKRAAYIEYAIMFLAAALMIVIYKYGFTPWLHERMTISGAPPGLHYPSIVSLLQPLFTWDGIRNVISRTGGHVFYLSIGSLGLIWLGFVDLWSNRFGPKNANNRVYEDLVQSATAIFLSLSVLGVVGLSVLLFSSTPEAQRLDHWMYGRYVEGVIAPVLLIGAMSNNFRNVIWAVPIAVISAALLSMEFETYVGIARFNISAFWQDFWFRDQGLWVWLATGCGLIGLAAWMPRRLGYSVVLAMFLYSSYLQISWHSAAALIASKKWDAALFVREKFPVGTCVGFDHSGINSYSRHVYWFDFGFQLFDYELKRISAEKWFEECDGPLFSYTRNLDEQGLNVHPAALSPQDGPTLWVKGRPAVDDIYPVSVADRSPVLLRVLATGWYDLEQKHVWSGKAAQLRLPIPELCNLTECHVEIKFAVYGASKLRPVDVLLSGVSIGPVEAKLISVRSSDPQEIVIPLVNAGSSQSIMIEVPSAISPKELQGSHDGRVLGIALFSIKLIHDELKNN